MAKKKEAEKGVKIAKDIAKEIFNYLSDKEYKTLDVELALGMAYSSMLAFNSVDEESILVKLKLIKTMALSSFEIMEDHAKTEGKNTD